MRLRNGAPFRGWKLPDALGLLRTRLSGRDEFGDGIGCLRSRLGPEIRMKATHPGVDRAETQVLDAHPRIHRVVEARAELLVPRVAFLGAERFGGTREDLRCRRQPLVARQRMGLDQGSVDAREIGRRECMLARCWRRTHEDQQDQGRRQNYACHELRPFRQRERRKASSAARSSAFMATTRSFAASASPPCQRIASSRLRAQPSCKKNVWPLTVSVSPMHHVAPKARVPARRAARLSCSVGLTAPRRP